MRNLITNDKLLKILTIIEQQLGYEIEVAYMPEEHKALASCSLSLQNDRFVLWIIENEIPLQVTLCHELMHLVLYIEGFPAFRITDTTWAPSEYKTQVISMLSNLVLHIEVWKLTDTLGFNEHEFYSLEELITMIETNSLFQSAYNPLIILPARAAYLAQALLSPAETSSKNRVRSAAEQSMPQALALADFVCAAFDKYIPLSPQSCVNALQDILLLIKCPKDILQPIFPNTVYTNFRSHIFSA